MKEYLKYFIGKACTITTVQINFRFKEEAMMDYFMGFVENVDDKGMWLVHPMTNCRSYILFPHIVSITEEQMLFEDNPEHAKIIAEYRKEKPLTAVKRAVPSMKMQEASPLVNPAALAEMAKKAKQAFTEEKK